MSIKTEIEVHEAHFNAMKKKAMQNKNNLLVYPAMLVLGLCLMYFDVPKLGTIVTEDPIPFSIIVVYLAGMFIYVWIKGSELNKVGRALTNDLNSICGFISLFIKYESYLKIAHGAFCIFLLYFIKRNPEIIELNAIVAWLFFILVGANVKIKDPAEWIKVDKLKIEIDQNR